MEDFYFLHNSFDDSKILPEIFLIEVDTNLGNTIKEFLIKKLGLKVNYFESTSDCLLELLADYDRPYCLITNISFEEGHSEGLDLIDTLKKRGHVFFSIVTTNFTSIETAIMATKQGVFHYLTKPFELNSLLDLVIQGITSKLNISGELLRNCTKMRYKESSSQRNNSQVFLSKFKIESPGPDDIFCGMIGRSTEMKNVFERIKKVAQTDSTILITGPSGTGKEMVALAIHQLSKRSLRRMVSVNCGAIPAELLESELFGHEKGAFTGAIANRKGRFELANGGTIFLDEIGDMPLLLQVKILRVLQNREIEPVGSMRTIDVDVRIITATNINLENAVKEGSFREDLFYRLNVIPVKVPALAKRRKDIPLLISYFLSRFSSADGSNMITFCDEALELLMTYQWPGNVRELENLIERLVILKGGGVIGINDLPAKFLETQPMHSNASNLFRLPEKGLDLRQFLSEMENSLIVQALELTKGNKNQASKLLNMNRTTLIEKMKKKGLTLN